MEEEPSATRHGGLSLRQRRALMASVVRRVRIAAGLSQRDLAVRLGKTHSHVSMIETGRRRLDALELYLIAGHVGLPPADLFGTLVAELDDQSCR